MKLEVYAGNLHHGGAVAVAAALVDELPSIVEEGLADWVTSFHVTVSSRVARELKNSEAFAESGRITFEERDDRPRVRALLPARREIDVRLTIFGPAYLKSNAGVEVTGFADGSIIPVGSIDLYESGQVPNSARQVLARRLKIALLNRYDAFIVQTPEMDRAVLEVLGARPTLVSPNVVAPVFLSPEEWTPCALPERQRGETRLFYPARAYPHKNHAVLPSICEAYREAFGRPLRVVVTLRENEADVLPASVWTTLINVGELSVAQCAWMYVNTDGLVFPSLNETSSSAPLEAMSLRRPVIATDAEFMRRMTAGKAFYVDFGHPLDTANAVDRATSGELSSRRMIEDAYDWVSSRGTVRQQALEYLQFVRHVMGA